MTNKKKIDIHNIRIRRPRMEDKHELHELFWEVIKDTYYREGLHHYNKQMDEILADKKKYLDTDFASNGTERYFLIAEIDQQIVGTIESGPSSKLLNECTSNTYKNTIELGTVFVLPDYQKLGIGSLLIQAMCKKLAGENVKEICLHSGYKIAGQVWKKILGKPTVILPEYWGKNYDHLIWCNKLSNSGAIIFNNN